jgi:dTDP-4-amino-4,6-dideoxygalactose transaminase
MSGIKQIKFNGVDRLYDAYSWRLTRRAKRVWSSGQVLQGPELEELEERFKKKYKRQYAVGVGSATDGLYFAMSGHGLNKGSTITCPVVSYVATAGAIKRLGAKLNFCDTDERGNLGSLQFQPKPHAVVYVNLYGNCADYDRIRKYCDDNRAILIEDAAQSMGAYYKKTWTKSIQSGQMGDTSVFSFDPTKNLPCFGSGGMILTDSSIVYEKVIALRRHGLQGSTVAYGYNSLPSEDHCAQLNFLFDKFDSLQKMRKKIAGWYTEYLPIGTLLQPEKDTVSSLHKLVLITGQRDRLQDFLAKQGIETRVHYSTTLDHGSKNHYPNAEYLCANCLSLPIYPFLEKSEVKYICEKIREFNGI